MVETHNKSTYTSPDRLKEHNSGWCWVLQWWHVGSMVRWGVLIVSASGNLLYERFKQNKILRF